MINYITGKNLLESHDTVLVNPVNCVGIMGAGLAFSFKKKSPGMFKYYKALCAEGSLDIGKVAFYYLNEDDTKFICLFPTKHHWKEKSNVYIIERSLKAFATGIEELGRSKEIKSAAFPKIGCGLGGLDFIHEVKPLMEQYLGELPITVNVYI